MELKGQASSTGKKITVVKEADFFNGDPAAICSFLQLSTASAVYYKFDSCITINCKSILLKNKT
jgi:hypothetical protein